MSDGIFDGIEKNSIRIIIVFQQLKLHIGVLFWHQIPVSDRLRWSRDTKESPVFRAFLFLAATVKPFLISSI